MGSILEHPRFPEAPGVDLYNLKAISSKALPPGMTALSLFWTTALLVCCREKHFEGEMGEVQW